MKPTYDELLVEIKRLNKLAKDTALEVAKVVDKATAMQLRVNLLLKKLGTK